MIGWLARAPWWEVLAIGAGINVVTVAASVAFWRALVALRPAPELVRPPTRRDVAFTASTATTNALTVLPGWWLLRHGWIEVPAFSAARFPLELLYLLVGLDLLAYLLHRGFHLAWIYPWFHQLHHVDDERMSPLTLFVMHPFEAAGFAGMVLVLLRLWPVSFAAVATFFTLNLVLGTVAHRPRPADQPVTVWDRTLGGSWLHRGHHEAVTTNYGFFTQGWDRLLRTRR